MLLPPGFVLNYFILTSQKLCAEHFGRGYVKPGSSQPNLLLYSKRA